MFDVENSIAFTVHGGQDSGGVAGGVDKFLTFVESLLNQTPGEIFAGVMPGIAALENLHPLFVHFPIALLPLFFLLDVAGSIAKKDTWRHTASWFLYLGTLFAAMTVTAGLIAAATVAHGDDVHEIMERHKHLGISVLSLAAVLSAWRLLVKARLCGPANTLYLICSGMLAGLLALTADLGGLMVYKYGVAVTPVKLSSQEAAAIHQHGGEAVEHEDAEASHDAADGHQHNHAH